jgi:hypothetical protein
LVSSLLASPIWSDTTPHLTRIPLTLTEAV